MEKAENRVIRITKTLNASIDQVWKVWSDPAHIANWWGPDGFTNTIHTMNLEKDGEWNLTMHGPDGKKYPNKSIFLLVEPKKNIVFQHLNPNYIATINFVSTGASTVLEWSVMFETAELYDTVVKVFKADEGLKQNVEKLENYLRNYQHEN